MFALEYRGQYHQVDYASHVSEVKFSRERELNRSSGFCPFFSQEEGVIQTPWYPKQIIQYCLKHRVGDLVFQSGQQNRKGRGKSHDGNLFLYIFFPQLDKGPPKYPVWALGSMRSPIMYEGRSFSLLLGSFF